MALKLLRKAEPTEAMTEFQVAEREFASVDKTFRDHMAEWDRRKVALNIAASGRMVEGEVVGKPAETVLKQTTAELIHEAEKRPDHARSEFQRLDAEIAEMRPKHIKAVEEWHRAKMRETTRVARLLRPRLAPLVERMEAALADLSGALADYESVAVEFRTQAPLPQSAHFPGIGLELKPYVDFSDPNTAASHWARRMRKEGLLP